MWNVEEISPGIWAGFTDAAAGNLAFHVGDDAGAVAARRSAVNQRLGGLLAVDVKLAYMNQVHGIEVAHIGPDAPGNATGNPAGTVPTADAMLAVGERAAARGLAVMVADCVPVVLAGRTAGGEPVVAVAHAGRPGVEQGVVPAVVAQMVAAGAGNVAARLGPSVCGRCYEVPADMRARVGAVAPAAHATTSWGTPSLDLPAAVMAQLAELGVAAVPSTTCTMEDPRWFSHRRSQRDATPEGRFAGFVATGSHHPGPQGQHGITHSEGLS